MSEWSDKWNAMPYEIRHIGSMCAAQQAIQYLKFEKDRLKKRYLQSIREINQHIKNHQEFIKREGR